MFKFPSSWSLCVGVYQVVKQIMNRRQWVTSARWGATSIWTRLITNWMPTTIQTRLVTNRVEITTQVGHVVRFNGQHINKSSSCSRFQVHPLISSKIPTSKIGFISNFVFPIYCVCVCVFFFQFPMCVLCVCGEFF